jgi:hypothetical protein
MKEAKRLDEAFAKARAELEAKHGKEVINRVVGELFDDYRRGVPPDQRVFVPWVDASRYGNAE